MFRVLICMSSGGIVYTAIGIFCVYYVGWLLAGLEFYSDLLAAEQISAQNMYRLLIVIN
jgi:hypothetical protein